MNYRHLYHAGNFADVFKHAVLVLLLRRLLAKDAPLAILDTHAGIGRYDLRAAEALKTAEFRHGIARLLAEPAPPPVLVPYLDLVRGANPAGGLDIYPGSPAIAAAMARPGDRIVLCELHPADASSLKRAFAADRRVAVHHMDGYLAVKAFLPPREHRGLVLIDPPFEAEDEAERLYLAFCQAHRRWPGGTLVLWYPIKDRPPIERFHHRLAASGIRRLLIAELLVRGAGSAEQLNGSGLLLVNPPWRIEEALAPLLDALAPLLAQGAGAGGTWCWLVPE